MKKGMANCLTKTLLRLNFVGMILITTGGTIHASEMKQEVCIESSSGRKGVLIDWKETGMFFVRAYVKWDDEKEKVDRIFLSDIILSDLRRCE